MKSKNQTLKMVKGVEQTSLQRRYSDGQGVLGKMLSRTDC